jgi:hypothetical protein
MSRSIRSFSRAAITDQRGFALITALVLAILYFGLVELLMLDAKRELKEARQFRSRIVSLTLAENAAELAAKDIVNTPAAQVTLTNGEGTMTGTMKKNAGGDFEIEGRGVTSGLDRSAMTVIVQGQVVGNQIRIHYTRHTE